VNFCGGNPICEMLFQGLRAIDASFHGRLYMVEKNKYRFAFHCGRHYNRLLIRAANDSLRSQDVSNVSSDAHQKAVKHEPRKR
jgi:hypothetical protein